MLDLDIDVSLFIVSHSCYQCTLLFLLYTDV